jgi:hypothetical protein
MQDHGCANTKLNERPKVRCAASVMKVGAITPKTAGTSRWIQIWSGRLFLAQSIEPSSLPLTHGAYLPKAAISPDSARTRSTAVSRDRFGNRKTRIARNISTSTRVSLSQAPVCATTIWSQSMTKSKLLGLAAILSAAIATPALAAGETATRPWSAPVGHRQPRAVDIPPSVSPQTLKQDDIGVDRKIRGVCRGC